MKTEYASLLLGALLSASPAWAVDWLTLQGDPARPDQDTVQVNPASIQRQGEDRLLEVRVNRIEERKNWLGVPYRSYTARVQVRCAERQAEYLDIRMFDQNIWRGQVVEQAYEPPRPPMRFLDMEPNPTERIVRAACMNR